MRYCQGVWIMLVSSNIPSDSLPVVDIENQEEVNEDMAG